MIAERDMAGCRCVTCGATALDTAGVEDKPGVQTGAVKCAACGAAYDVIDGIPYLLVIEPDDFLTLIEIAGEFDSRGYDIERAIPFDDSWPEILAARHKAEDAAAFRATLPPSQAAQVEDRYEQWREIHLLSETIDLEGKNVLVVGAGMGFDANIVRCRGAHVTAVDLNPHTNVFGRVQLPQARWIAAIGRRLPFIDGYFDHVFISASLHHVLDVSATIVEMLRVLKPGGSLITSNDSFSSDSTTDLEDAKFWNDHQDVLRGINENTPRLRVFIDPVLERLDDLDVEFWTSRIYNIWVEAQQKYMSFMLPRRWLLDADATRLRGAAGGMFMRVTPKKQIANPFKAPGAPIIRPGALKNFIGHKREAMAHYANIMPEKFLSPRFPGPAGNTKFQVLNGWRWTEPREIGREAFQLARWFLRRTEADKALHIVVRPPIVEDVAETVFHVAVDGRAVAIKRVASGESGAIAVDISSVRTDAPIAIEIEMISEGSSDFAKNLFRVERLVFERPALTRNDIHMIPDEAALLEVLERIQGDLPATTALIWREIFDQQKAWGLAGPIIDMQPKAGRSTRVLAELMAPKEKLVVLDYENLLDDLEFKHVSPVFIAAGGEQMAPALPQTGVRAGSAQFICVTPPPHFSAVSTLLKAAAEFLAIDGVLALHQAEHPHLPGIWAGALHAVFTGADLRPFLISENRAYFCRPRAHGRFLRMLRNPGFDNILDNRLMLSRTDSAPEFDVFRISPRDGGEKVYGEALYRRYYEI